MRDQEHSNFKAIAKIAEMLSQDQLGEFVSLLPTESRKNLRDHLEKKNSATDAGGTSGLLAATVIVEATDDTITRDQDAAAAESENVKLVKLHARGAVGEVFVAFDHQLSREVALKRIRPDLPQTSRRFDRFVREAAITAKLQHPCIVPVYDFHLSGQDVHYTMPLVSGSNLSTLIARAHKEMDPSPRYDQWIASLRPLLVHFIAVCNAIDYAHSQNVLHRDIKPENVMIGTQGQTIVLDWGCAKEIEEGPQIQPGEPQIQDSELAEILGVEVKKGMTIAGSVMGTLEYMSPEQAAGDIERVGKQSDIFGLGTTLFNLLTNEPAIEFSQRDTQDVDHALKAVRQGMHRGVEDVSNRVPRALVEVCQRAMAFAPKDRYRSAGDLGRDVDAFLAGEPVSVYAEPVADRALRFVKRYRTAFTTLVGMLLVGFLSLGFVALQINKQRDQEARKNDQLEDLNSRLTRSVAAEKQLTHVATVREQESTQRLYDTEMLLASEAFSNPGGFGRMRELVGRWNDPQRSSFTGWEWEFLTAMGNQERWTAALDATANRIVFTRDQSLGRVFDFENRMMVTIDTMKNRIVERRSLPEGVTAADLNRDQSLLALGFENGKVTVLDLENEDEDEPVELDGLDSAVTDISWNIGGDYLAASDSAGQLSVWQWFERQQVASASGVLNMARKRLLNWSFDGQRLSWTTGKQIRELAMDTKQESVIAEDDWIVSPCWSHEGKLLSWIGPNNIVVVEDPKQKTRSELKGHQLFVETLHWHPSLHFLLSSSADGSVRIWNVDDSKEVRHFFGHNGPVFAADWNQDGSRVVSGGLPDDQLHVWDASNLGESAFDRELQSQPAIDWHPDGSLIALAEGSDVLLVEIDGKSTTLKDVSPDGEIIFGIAFDPSGKRIACVSELGKVWTVDARRGELIKVYDSGSDQKAYPPPTTKSVAWSPDGKYLAGIGSKRKVRVWDDSSGEEVAAESADEFGKALVIAWQPQKANHSSDVTPQTPALAVAGTEDHVFVFQPKTRKITQRLAQFGWKTGLDWSPDGTRIAASDRRCIRVWDVETENQVGRCDGPNAMVLDLSWSQSQQRIAAVAEDGMICLWHEETFAFCGKFDLHQRSPYAVCWSPDGEQLLSTARHGRMVLQKTAMPKDD